MRFLKTKDRLASKWIKICTYINLDGQNTPLSTNTDPTCHAMQEY